VAGKLIVVAPFSGRAIKNWPAARFAAVILWMVRELGATVVLVGREDERGAAAALERLAGGVGVYNLVGRTRLEEAFALVARADVFLGNDSGLAHAAALLRRPTVALYAGVAPVARWQPLGPEVTVLRTEVACAPCGLRHLTDCVHGHACMDAIPVGTVQAAVQSALRRAPGSVARAEALAVGP
jgi:ADP-heptose:LPS heptosyltransferase